MRRTFCQVGSRLKKVDLLQTYELGLKLRSMTKPLQFRVVLVAPDGAFDA